MNMFSKFSKLILSFFLLSSFMALSLNKSYAANLIEDIKKKGKIKVGMSIFVPWSFRDINGDYVGFEIDIAKKLAKDLGVKLELVPTNWDGIIPALKTGKMDIIIAGMSVTEKREKAVDFSDGYSINKTVVVGLKKNKNVKISNLNDAKYTVAVRRGSQPANILKSQFPKAKALFFDEDGISLQEVVNGGADFTIDSIVSAVSNIEENKNLVLLEKGKSVLEDYSAMAIKKGNPEALKYINNWIKVNKKSGYLEEKTDYWFNSTEWKKNIKFKAN